MPMYHFSMSKIFKLLIVISLIVGVSYLTYKVINSSPNNILGISTSQANQSWLDKITRYFRKQTQPAQSGKTTTDTTSTSTPSQVPGAQNPGTGIPFGPFHLPSSNYGSTTYPFTGAMYEVAKVGSTTELKATLDSAKAEKVKLLVHLTGGRRGFQKSDGAFDLAAFKSKLDLYKSFDFSAYSDVIIGHLMLDEPQDPNNWNGKAVPFADIEAAAAYSKSLWPTMPTAIGSNPTFLKGAGTDYWKNLDFTVTPYAAKKGDVTKWKDTQVADAKILGLGLMLSINVLDGGSSKKQGESVSATQLTSWATTLASDPYVCGLTLWKWDPKYFSSADMKATTDAVLNITNVKAATSCKKH